MGGRLSESSGGWEGAMSLSVILEAGEEAALTPLATYRNACPATPKASCRERRKFKAAVLETSARTNETLRA